MVSFGSVSFENRWAVICHGNYTIIVYKRYKCQSVSLIIHNKFHRSPEQWSCLSDSSYLRLGRTPNNLKLIFTSETYTNILAINEKLRHVDRVHLHSISDLLLMHVAHEDISLLELHHQRVENLFNGLTFCVRGSYDSHACRVEDNLAAVFLFVILQKRKVEVLIGNCCH